MSLTQYNGIVAELYAAIVMQQSYQEVASLVLRGAAFTFDIHKVLDDAKALAFAISYRDQNVDHEMFPAGLRVFQQTFAAGNPEFYRDLGFESYFEKPRATPLRDTPSDH